MDHRTRESGAGKGRHKNGESRPRRRRIAELKRDQDVEAALTEAIRLKVECDRQRAEATRPHKADARLGLLGAAIDYINDKAWKEEYGGSVGFEQVSGEVGEINIGKVVPNRLRPTLWKTCRVLANNKRLNLLRVLRLLDGEMMIKEIAKQAALSVATCGQYLKHIQARGLIAVSRRGKCGFYRLSPDKLINESDPLLHALLRAFDLKFTNYSIRKELTSFTHPVRVKLVQILAQEPLLDYGSLAAKLNMTVRSLPLHLDKLARRGVIGINGDSIQLLPPRNHLAAVLRKLAIDR